MAGPGQSDSKGSGSCGRFCFPEIPLASVGGKKGTGRQGGSGGSRQEMVGAMGVGPEGSGQLSGESIRMDRDWDLIGFGSKGSEDGRIPARFLAQRP